MINFESGGHWYDKEGKPSHDSTLREARKLLLYRSVTSIDKDVFKNEFIERYKMDQLAEAAWSYPKAEGESVDDYSDRIYKASLEHVNAAGSFGTEFHAAAEGKGYTERIKPFVEHFLKWQEENVIQIIAEEKTLVDHDIGVAGRMDRRFIHRVHGLVTADFKTQGIKYDKKSGKKNKPNFYDSFIRQLAFYDAVEAKAAGLFPTIGPCLSVVIDSIDPAPPYERLWSRDETIAAYEDFVIASYAYYKKKNYWPCGRWRLQDKLNQLGI